MATMTTNFDLTNVFRYSSYKECEQALLFGYQLRDILQDSTNAQVMAKTNAKVILKSLKASIKTAEAYLENCPEYQEN